MKSNGSRICDSPAVRHRSAGAVWRIAAVSSISMALFIGACQTTDETPPPQRTQAQLDLDDSSEDLSRALVTDTEQEGAILGGLIGAGIGFGIGSRDDGGGGGIGVSVPIGAFAGSVAGRYVSAKQDEYTKKVEVIEAITRDVRSKNEAAARAIKAMEIVVAEHRARLAQLRAAKTKSRRDELRLEQQIAMVEKDLQTMRGALGKAEEHLALFGEARGLIVKKDEPGDIVQQKAVISMDGEIRSLRSRIQAMHKLVNDLSAVG